MVRGRSAGVATGRTVIPAVVTLTMVRRCAWWCGWVVVVMARVVVVGT